MLLRHWPALLAWFLGGMLVRQLLIELAGFVGGRNSTGGLLILSLAVLARLIGFVGMFLVIRDGLRTLQSIAPLPTSAKERRQDFMAALLASVLPFFAVYAAQKQLRGDLLDYADRALSSSFADDVFAAVEGTPQVENPDIVLTLSFNVWTILIIVVAIAGRMAWRRWESRLPKLLALLALYLEVVWVFFSLLLLTQLLDGAVEWIGTREVTAWIVDTRSWLAAQFVPLGWLFDGFEQSLDMIGRVLVEPFAWLIVAGVIYGQTITSERLRIGTRLLERTRRTAGMVPAALRRRVDSLAEDLGSRVQPIGRAIRMVWQAGPIVLGTYLLLYACMKALEPLLGLGIMRALGPHDTAFWTAIAVVFALVPALIVEPIRVSLIAGTYDSALSATPEAASAQGATGSLTNSEPAPYGEISIQNGPSASSGMMNGTNSSYVSYLSESHDTGDSTS